MTTDHKPIQLKFSCGQDWNAMTPVEGGRHCHECRKTVYDFTDSKPDEFRRILAEHGYNLCGRFTSDQASIMTPALPFWKRWAAAAVMFIGLSAVMGKAEAQKKTVKHQPQKVSSKPDTTQIIMGDFIEMDPEFPGGMGKFHQYIAKNLRYNGVSRGEVTVQFIVERDGSLGDIKIAEGLAADADSAVLAVVRKSPKWKPGIRNGRPFIKQFKMSVQIGKVED